MTEPETDSREPNADDTIEAWSRSTGMVLGKFYPPTLGHCYLVDFARHYVGHLTVIVASLSNETIPGETRAAWMREMFPDAHVDPHHRRDPAGPWRTHQPLADLARHDPARAARRPGLPVRVGGLRDRTRAGAGCDVRSGGSRAGAAPGPGVGRAERPDDTLALAAGPRASLLRAPGLHHRARIHGQDDAGRSSGAALRHGDGGRVRAVAGRCVGSEGVGPPLPDDPEGASRVRGRAWRGRRIAS